MKWSKGHGPIYDGGHRVSKRGTVIRQIDTVILIEWDNGSKTWHNEDELEQSHPGSPSLMTVELPTCGCGPDAMHAAVNINLRADFKAEIVSVCISCKAHSTQRSYARN